MTANRLSCADRYKESDLFNVAYQAQAQFNGLSQQEQAELTRLLGQGKRPADAHPVEPSGRFVSRLGEDKRVLWKQAEDGNIVILSIMVQ